MTVVYDNETAALAAQGVQTAARSAWDISWSFGLFMLVCGIALGVLFTLGAMRQYRIYKTRQAGERAAAAFQKIQEHR